MEQSKRGRNESFKKKSSTVDKRSLRAHRRSIEWKQQRDQTINQNRPNFGELSPLQEIHPNNAASRKAENRKDMLMKWKAEKELKKKLEAQEKARNKPFKVAKASNINLDSQKQKGLGKNHISQPPSKKPVVVTKKAPVKTAAMAKGVQKSASSSKTVATSRVTRSTRSTQHQTMKAPVKAVTTKAETSKTRNTRAAKESTKPATNARTISKKQTQEAPRVARTTRTTKDNAVGPTARKSTRETTTNKNLASKRQVNTVPQGAKNSKHSAKSSALASVKENVIEETDAQDDNNKQDNAENVDKVPHATPKPILKPARKTTMDSVNAKRGSRFQSGSDSDRNEQSFAPSNFQFQAPANLQEFFPVFTPLSPASTQRFLMPTMAALSSPEGGSRRCSTPKFDVTKKPLVHSPQTSVICEINSASSASESDEGTLKDSQPRGSSSSAPVLSLEGELVKQAESGHQSRDEHTSGPQDKQEKAQNNTQPFTTKSVSFDMDTKDKSSSEKEEKETAMETSGESGESPDHVQHEASSKEVPGLSKSPVKQASQSLPEELIIQHSDPSNKENTTAHLHAAAIFKTPEPVTSRGRRSRTRSLGRALSGKKTPRNNRNSLILRHLSPEEGVEVLKHSPMVELTRRTPKSLKASSLNLEPLVLPNFDDIDEELSHVSQEENKPQTTPELHSPETSQNTQVTSAPAMEPEASSDIVNEQIYEVNEIAQDMHSANDDVEMVPDTGDSVKTDKLEGSKSQEQDIPNTGDSLKTDKLDGSKSQEQEQTSTGDIEEHDVPYFRKLLVVETEKLDAVCKTWENISVNTPELSEEVQGQIRTATGKAQLLIAQRFKQFSGLVDACEFKTGEKETTCQDLQGFWDMIYFQIEDVHALFYELDVLKERNWHPVEALKPLGKKKITKKKAPVKNTTKPAGKSKFAQFRAQMKKQANENEVETEPVKTFEGGFFKVNSPVKSPAPHCDDKPRSAVRSAKRISYSRDTPSSATASPLLKVAVARSARLSGPSPLSKTPQPLTDMPTKAVTMETEQVDTRMRSECITSASESEAVKATPKRSARRKSTRRSIKPESNNATSEEDGSTGSESQSEAVPTAEVATSEVNSNSEETSRTSKAAMPTQDESSAEHDVPYFRQLLVTESEKLQALCDQWGEINTSDLLEHVSGQIRTAIGKAQLLIAQRFKQFSGLVDACEFNTGEKQTTCQDLQGFWDMIYFQVEDVHGLFAELSKLQANNWHEEESQSPSKPKPAKKKPIGKTNKKKAAGAGASSKFAAFRANLIKQKKEAASDEAESEGVKTFEAGFFQVTSPVRSPSVSRRSGEKLAVSSAEKSLRDTTPRNSPLRKELLIKNARSRGPSPLIASPISGRKRKASTDEPVTFDSEEHFSVPSKLLISSSGSEEAPQASSGLSALLTASSQENTPMQPEQGMDELPGGSLFTPEQPVRSVRRSSRRSVMNAENNSPAPNCDNAFAQMLLPSTQPEESDMECESVMSPPTDVEMSARMKRDLLSQFNDHSKSAAKKRRSVGANVVEQGRSTPSQRRRLSALKLSERAAHRPSTPFIKDVPRRRSSMRRSMDVPALAALDSVTDSAVAAADAESPATCLARLSVTENSPASTQRSGHRHANKSRRISGFTPPQSSTSPAERLAVVHEDLMGFCSPASTRPESTQQDTDSTTTTSTSVPKTTTTTTPARRRSTRNRRVSGFTPPETQGSPAGRLPSVREVDDLIAFSPLANDSEARTPRRSRRSIRVERA